MTKDQRQLQAIERFFDSSVLSNEGYRRGGFAFPTGFGKTTTAIKIIQDDRIKDTSIVILVHTDALKHQWNMALESQGVKNVIVNTVQYCIANGVEYSCNLLIVDEVHRFYRSAGAGFVEYINGDKIKFNHYLWLSATPKDRYNRHEEIFAFAPVLDRIDEAEALRYGWIANYYTFNFGIDLPDEKVEIYNNLADEIHKNVGKFVRKNNQSYELAFKTMAMCLSGGKDEIGNYYDGFKWACAIARTNGWRPDGTHDEQTEELWNPGKVIGYAKKCMADIRERKEMLWNDKKKVDIVVELLKRFDTHPTVSFSESVEFANLVYHAAKREGIPSGVYHSQIESGPLRDPDHPQKDFYRYKTGQKKGEPKIFSAAKQKEYYLDELRESYIRYLSTARALDEGFDAPNVRLGIITSFSSNSQQYIQRTGRIKRVFEDHSALIVNIYFKNTKEEEWLKKASAESDKDKIFWVDEIDQITPEVENFYYL